MRASLHLTGDIHTSIASPASRFTAYRWVVLALLCLLSISNNFLYSCYFTIVKTTVTYYDVSEGQVNLLGTVFLFTYFAFFVPAAWVPNIYFHASRRFSQFVSL